MDFIQKLWKFFSFEKQQRISDSEIVDNSKLNKIDNISINFFDEENESAPTFTLNLRLEKPDIIIVENMDSIDTDALIFHVITKLVLILSHQN